MLYSPVVFVDLKRVRSGARRTEFPTRGEDATVSFDRENESACFSPRRTEPTRRVASRPAGLG
jgi:hypothetical protein